MADIKSILQELVDRKRLIPDAAKALLDDPSKIQRLFAPLWEAGFADFNLKAHGTNSIVLSPTDNDQIVFRVAMDIRHDDGPFFLQSAYRHEIGATGGVLAIELLLRGEKVTDEQKPFLLSEMDKAGWRTRSINKLDRLWDDVIAITLRGKDGRVKTVPIIADPSAKQNYVEWAIPKDRNTCSADYITLQDQAAAYNNAIGQDARLKILAPTHVEFEETSIISTPNPVAQR